MPGRFVRLIIVRMHTEVNKLKYKNILFLSTLLFFILINACTDESTTSPLDELIKSRIDLQSGFEGHYVIIECNSEIIFNAILSESVPLSGPLATFTTYLPKGNNEMYILWTLNYPFLKDSIDFILEDTENCYIGIQLSNDTIYFQIQNNEFLYL